jgi:hypothetical protein
MANKGCNNCAHYKNGEMKMWEDDIPSSCLIGNGEEFRLWWEENGRKKNVDEITDMPCFQETKLSEILSEMSRLLDEIKKTVSKT